MVTVYGSLFRPDASPATVFCLFSELTPGEGYAPWMKVPGTVLGGSSLKCRSPPFSQYGYGYAASTFKQPSQRVTVHITFDNFHWHRIPGTAVHFSFFDVLRISPTMSSAQFELGDDRTLSFNPGNFLNEQALTAYCWWKVPGTISPTSAFVVQGQRQTGSRYVCLIPDWTDIRIDGQPAITKLPCNQSFVVGTGAVCHQDGRLEVPFGVAFVRDITTAVEEDFSFGLTFSFYARPRF
jgi:hypothetical protein